MATVKFDEATLTKVKNRLGIYRNTERLTIIELIEKGFRDYARAHKGCTKEMEETEWNRFKSKLKKYIP